jgi:vacuolar-type H+-ATPase subunit I/STV1
MFEAIIQGGRLNIIEFKLKFVKGGGRPFRPFALKKD